MLSSGTAFASGIVASPRPVTLQIGSFHRAVEAPPQSGWGATATGSVVTVSHIGNTDCMVVAIGKTLLRPVVISDRDGNGQPDLCHSQDRFEHTSANRTGSEVAFGANFPFNPTITNSGTPEVYLAQRPNVVQVTGSWSAHGWFAADPALSRDGLTIAFIGNGDPVGENPQGVEQVFAYDVPTGTFTQLTHAGGCLMQLGFQTAVSGDGNRIAFASKCDLTGDNPEAYTRPFVIDRRLGVTTQLADCEPHECNIGAPIAISDDGSTVALQDNAYLTNYAALMVHRLDASNHETQTFQKQIGWFDGQFLILGEPAVAPALSEDGNRVAYTGMADDGLSQVYILDDPFGAARVTQVTHSLYGYSYGTALNPKGDTLYVGEAAYDGTRAPNGFVRYRLKSAKFS